MLMKQITNLKQDWKYRRPLIYWVCGSMIGLIASALGTAVFLAAIGKFGVIISTFFSILVICAFFTLLAVLGSYVFGAAWENDSFLKLVPQLLQHKDEDADDSGEHS